MVFAARMPISISSLTKANSSCPMAHMDNGDACELGQLPSKKGFSGNEELRSTMPQVFIRLHRLQPYQFQLYVDVVSCVHAANKCSGLFFLAWTKNGQADNARQHCDYRVTPSYPWIRSSAPTSMTWHAHLLIKHLARPKLVSCLE
jgi:hypothetical protein